ncbi:MULTISPECIES: hypothetical protein [unclassified Microcoleus]|uniref:hypothetical protein n=1 Tax=unclassified Microcoleus TaxID=2642155 RepID=UPI0025DBEA50|nr:MULTISPECIES: hypothetical protein [unclassified Microcoleus]
MSKLTIPAPTVSYKNYIANPGQDTAMPFPYSELSGIWKCAIDLCLLWSETGFFPRISLHRLKTTKNPVSLVYAVVTDARVARNRVFSRIFRYSR